LAHHFENSCSYELIIATTVLVEYNDSTIHELYHTHDTRTSFTCSVLAIKLIIKDFSHCQYWSYYWLVRISCSFINQSYL